jgi:hypothetical protein
MLALSPKFGVKPYQTRIQLTKTTRSLEVVVPPLGFRPAVLKIVGLAILWNGFLAFWTFGIQSPVSWGFVLFSLPFWIIGATLIAGAILLLYQQSTLRIDDRQISLTSEILGWRLHTKKPAAVEEIQQLTYIPFHYSRRSGTESLAELKIQAGQTMFDLGGQDYNVPNPAEVEWLALEISEWLDIPLEIIEI